MCANDSGCCGEASTSLTEAWDSYQEYSGEEDFENVTFYEVKKVVVKQTIVETTHVVES
jgi:hypothetical protein